MSVEDKPPSTWGSFDDDEDDAPKIAISNASESIQLDDIEDLDAPVPTPAPTPVPTHVPVIETKPLPVDIDEPLGSTDDFETLA